MDTVIASIRIVAIINLYLAFTFYTSYYLDVVASFTVNANILTTTHTITHV